jgi:hypothetical protein
MHHFTPPAPVIAYRDTPEGQRAQSAAILARLGPDKPLPPFQLTNVERAEIDMLGSNDARTARLQVLHQIHAYKHRDMSIFGMATNPAAFSRWWLAREAEFMADAWSAYLDGDVREVAA